MMMIVEVQNAARGYSLFAVPDVQRRSATTTRTPRPIASDHHKSQGAFTVTPSAALHEGPEFHYVTTMLPRTTGSHSNATTRMPHLHFHWFSPTHPLDPSLFHRLERYPTSHSFVSFPEDSKDSVFEGRHKLGPRYNRR
ncbi:hypothetical protein VIGAN_08073900 [Vigna angularis var. angularis]|uniref:Uncharacterized protein n=1 Tax=Vigna angularis var. angularis TaxID=157739 RepID=A0A0S3SMU6_PHAAN|nr:hypothetical protein VIGAN_08073900 [Vigna angularis var. angularis]